MTLALVLGIACNLENLAMSLVLPVWRRDVKTLRGMADACRTTRNGGDCPIYRKKPPASCVDLG